MFFIQITKRWAGELQLMRHLVVAPLPVVAGTRFFLFWDSKPPCSWELINSIHSWLSYIKNRKIRFKKDQKYIKFRLLNSYLLLQLLRWIPGLWFGTLLNPAHGGRASVSVFEFTACCLSFFFFFFFWELCAVASLKRFEQVFAC